GMVCLGLSHHHGSGGGGGNRQRDFPRAETGLLARLSGQLSGLNPQSHYMKVSRKPARRRGGAVLCDLQPRRFYLFVSEQHFSQLPLAVPSSLKDQLAG